MTTAGDDFSPRTLRALQKWPDVPHLYGWLRLTRRGDWLLRGSPVQRAEIRDVISRHYTRDERGCWYFQNGPQRGYVALEYAPFVASTDGAGQLRLHTGAPLETPTGASIDEEGALCLHLPRGPALLDDRDSAWALDHLLPTAGDAADGDDREALLPEALAAALAQPSGSDSGLCLRWEDSLLPLQRIDAADLPAALGFVRDPAPEASAD